MPELVVKVTRGGFFIYQALQTSPQCIFRTSVVKGAIGNESAEVLLMSVRLCHVI
jgi:hypothetical protein